MAAITPELGVDHYLLAGCGRCKWYDTPQCKVHRWKEELVILRSLMLDCGLNETIKWGVPCYMYNKANIILLGAFREYCCISFFKGSLLKDSMAILEKAGENTYDGRIVKILNTADLQNLLPHIKDFILQAIEIEKSGQKLIKTTKTEPIPTELEEAFVQLPDLKEAFFRLTPGRQRGYILHFSQPKQSATRVSRIQKWIPYILTGKGMMDK